LTTSTRDWSPDVCSSDLERVQQARPAAVATRSVLVAPATATAVVVTIESSTASTLLVERSAPAPTLAPTATVAPPAPTLTTAPEIGSASCRERGPLTWAC